MKIIYTQSIKQEVKKQIKQFKPKDIIFRVLPEYDKIKITLWDNIDKELSLSYNIQPQEYKGNNKNLTMDFYPNDVFLDMLLDNCILECHSKNLNNIRINDSEPIYFEDTIFIHNEKRTMQARKDKICFDSDKMIGNLA